MLWTERNIKWEIKSERDGLVPAADLIVAFTDRNAVDGGQLLLHPELDRELRDRAKLGIYASKSGEAEFMPTLGLVPEKYAAYAGIGGDFRPSKKWREAAGSLGKSLLSYRISKIAFLLPTEWLAGLSSDERREVSQAFMEGLLLGLYRKQSAAAESRPEAVLEEIAFILNHEEAAKDWNEGLRRGYETANAVCYARELTNEPANLLTPERLAEEARSLAAHYGLDCLIYDEKDAAREGMGGLLAVGGGSANPPRMIVLRHNGNPESKETLGIIGKGITFDTGGISLKKAEGMEEMISDMGGAAAVMGAMRAVGERKPAANVVAVISAAENMPSGSAFKPGDVIRMYGGQTVEVLNTDAEGRIVLADGLTTAIRHGATRLIDVATLTGAVMHALGDWSTGAFSNAEGMLQSFLRSSERAGEYVWPLPTFPEYQSLLKSDVADLKNHGGAWAGAIAGALFVGAFAEDRPWIHLDIGGTAWMWSDRGFEGKGGTGVMVRSLLEYIRNETGASE